MRHKPRIEPLNSEASPLGQAISVADRETLTMVDRALTDRRLALAFQPVVLTRDPTRIGFHEALIRVMEPSGRIIPAKDFMPVVETRELGRQIDTAALRMGLQTLQRHPDVRISVNMSARSVGYGPWMATLKRGLAAGPTIAERLILEITESSAMLVPELVVRFMADLQAMGISFAIDDFGAGATCLRYFRDFAFDILKIDGMFVRGIEGDPDNQALVQAMIGIARHFHMMTVAEMIETEAEATVLRAMGVDCLQGYAFGAPTVRPAFAEAARRQA
jgi:EAL domain-containing protein (putative c-di-GMP-specific phosphodiesterase class I)